MSTPSLAQRLMVAGTLPRMTVRETAPVKIGALVPMSGSEEAWGRPGIDGARIWVDWINDHGGLMVGGRRHQVELIMQDAAQGGASALEAARQMVEVDQISLMLVLGGGEMGLALDYLMQRRVLTATLLPSDLSPEHPYLIAPAETHPFFNVLGVDWLARERPQARRVALCSQRDLMGLPSLAVFRAAFGVAEREIVHEEIYDPEDGDAGAIVARMLAQPVDILCFCSAAPPMMEALTVAAYEQGFEGDIVACTCDHYERIIARTSPEFMERFIYHFPDFNDPLLADTPFFFHQPAAFFEAYNKRFPRQWSAVSWEYAAILDTWQDAVEIADSVAPVPVLTALKRGRMMPNAFGVASWWGKDVFGIDNALVGDWPVVAIRDGKARIQEFGSVLEWVEENGGRLIRELERLDQLWHQKVRPDLDRAMARD